MFNFVRKSELNKALAEKADLSARLKEYAEREEILKRELETAEIRLHAQNLKERGESLFSEDYFQSLENDINKAENDISKRSQILKLITALISVASSKARSDFAKFLEFSKLEAEKKVQDEYDKALNISKLDVAKKVTALRQEITVLDAEIVNSSIEKIKIAADLAKSKNEKLMLDSEVASKRAELDNLNASVEFSELEGSITNVSTLISDLSSSVIKFELDKVNKKRKDIARRGEAWNIYAHYTLNNNSAAGKAQQKRLAKFLLVAFDTQVDNIIAFSNKSEFSKAHSKIELWFEKVNKLGGDHFVVIEREYLKLRLEELKFTFQYFMRRKYEKDEERYISESIREEKKVQKEIEDFVKNRENEAREFLTDIERIKREILESSEADAEKMKETINHLQLKLAQANAEKDRAISLAQLTRSGHVYVISNEKSFGKGIYKIGMTRRLDPMDRVKELGNASVPFFFDVHGIIHSDDAPGLERELHRKFDNKRVNKQNYRREFFEVSLTEIQAAITEIHGKVMLEQAAINFEEFEFTQDED